MYVYVFILIILVLISIYILKNTTEYTIKDKIIADEENLIKFYTDYRFPEVEDTINLEAPYNCTGVDLHKCNVNDQTSCFGCKSLLSTCIHFDEDTKFIDSTGEESIIPKNDSEEEGYCLQVKKLSDSCSIHGDLAIIQSAPDSFDYSLICICKNPGLIGNSSILGNCTDVHICSGKIDNINKPISEISCLCEENQISDRINDIPYCRDKLVTEINGDDDINWNTGTSLAPIDYFVNTIVQNLPTNIKYLKDPCSYCPITGKSLPVKAVLKNDQVFCQEIASSTEIMSNVVITDSNTINGRILKGDRGGDVALGIKWENILVYMGFETKITTWYVCKKSDNPDYAHLFDDEKEYMYIKGPTKGVPGVHFLYGFITSYACGLTPEMYTWNWKLILNTANQNKKTETSRSISSYNSSSSLSLYYLRSCPYASGCSSWTPLRYYQYSYTEFTDDKGSYMGTFYYPRVNYLDLTAARYANIFKITNDGQLDLLNLVQGTDTLYKERLMWKPLSIDSVKESTFFS